MTGDPTEAGPARPALTLPPSEAEWLRASYADARVILEYGSGGSTAMAAEMPGKRVFSVESDGDWTQSMRAWFAAHPPVAELHLLHVDVGPTLRWGKPRDNRAADRFLRYPLDVWNHPDFAPPDLVLIDGRFRLGCLLACAFRTERPVTVLFDDYENRPQYRVAETFAEKVETRGRMARFVVSPREIDPAQLARIVELMMRKM